MSYTTPLVRWLQRKRYQYEVTFSLYMLTPTEKFIFNSFLFLFLSMIIIAASLYLPQHITTILSRAWFYYAGEDEDVQLLYRGGAGAGVGAAGGVGAGGKSGAGATTTASIEAMAAAVTSALASSSMKYAGAAREL